MSAILENELIERLAAGFRRSPHQLNGLGESDAELLRLPGTDVVLALTTDGVVEEIESGLYDDPYLIGWMTVMVNASDLAAVGAEPLGLLLNETLAPGLADDYLAALQAGVADACSACGLLVLGGDTNFSTGVRMMATAIGTVTGDPPLTRRGCRPGDRLYASGPLGLGSAFALQRLVLDQAGGSDPEITYRPSARLREGRLLRCFASCCMDTSDGVIPTLDELMRRNGMGFELTGSAEQLLDHAAARLAESAGLPGWLMLAGPHGEFELLFTVSDARCYEFTKAAASLSWGPLEIGTVTAEPRLTLPIDGRCVPIDTARVRNLFLERESDVGRYIDGLLELAAELAAAPSGRISCG